MDENVVELLNKFNKIAELRYVKSTCNGNGAIGQTFEQLLGKNADDMYFPDYRDIEIKCTGRYSRFPISLFSCAFDGPSFPEINRVIDKYGYCDELYPDKKVLFFSSSCTKYTLLNNYYFNFDCDITNNKLFLQVFDENMQLVDRESFIYLDTIINHLKLKLNRLAVVYASIKRSPQETFFRYYKINIYSLKSINQFLILLKQGIIKIELVSRISKQNKDKAIYKNKNIVFKIDKKDINLLFNEIIAVNHDFNDGINEY